MRISDWSSDVCSSDLLERPVPLAADRLDGDVGIRRAVREVEQAEGRKGDGDEDQHRKHRPGQLQHDVVGGPGRVGIALRSEEHTSELQSLMRISYAVFCLKKKKKQIEHTTHIETSGTQGNENE